MDAKTKFVVNAFFYGIILLLFVLFYKYILPILTPFIIGFCVASLVHFILKRLRLTGKKHDKVIASVMCVGIYAAIAGLLFLFGATIVSQVRDFATALPGLFDTYLYPFFPRCAEYIAATLDPIDPALVDWIFEVGKSLASTLGEFATNLSAAAVKLVASGAVSIPGLLIQIILTIVSTFYIATDYDRILDFLKKQIPETKRELTLQAFQYAEKAVFAFIKSYVTIFFLTWFELSVGLMILGIPYAVVIALAIAFFDLMPILGTGGILLPWAVILLFMGNYPLAVGILVLYLVVVAVRNAVEPRIVGDRIGLHPLATLVALVLGLQLMGLVGMLLFPIVLVAITNLRASRRAVSGSEETK